MHKLVTQLELTMKTGLPQSGVSLALIKLAPVKKDSRINYYDEQSAIAAIRDFCIDKIEEARKREQGKIEHYRAIIERAKTDEEVNK